MYLEGQVVVLLFLFRSEGIPPLAQDLADGPVILVGVALMNQRPMALAENHKGVHRSPNVVLLPLRMTNRNHV